MNNWINYHHLLYFKTIVEEGSISKAAEKLRLKQPTLSAQLKLFEDQLGVQLFERQHKRLILTEQGKVAFEYSKNIFGMGSEMFEVIHDRLKPTRPTLHIGALDSVPKQIILKLVQNAMKISPCQISLIEGNSDELIRELISHKLDIVISNFIPLGSDAKKFSPRILSKKNVAFYGAPHFKHLKKKFPHSITDAPLILPTYDSKMRFDLEHWAKSLKIDLNIIVESQDISMKKLMAINGIGIITAAEHTVKKQLVKGELIEIGKTVGVYEELFLITANRKIENSLAMKLASTFNI